MKYAALNKSIGLSTSTRMAFKLSSLVVLLVLCYSMVSSVIGVQRVHIPRNCASACPPQRDPSRYICARNPVTKQLGMFDSECFFGRYNHCVYVKQPYEFVRYGYCKSVDF